jgi:hypothetical protein
MEDKEIISELKVMKSAAGYYIGREMTDSDGMAMPYGRHSDYYESHNAASRALERKEYKNVPAG